MDILIKEANEILYCLLTYYSTSSYYIRRNLTVEIGGNAQLNTFGDDFNVYISLISLFIHIDMLFCC